MVTALDDVVGNVTATLKELRMFENTIIIFSSDNGGIKENKEGNLPLKGYFITTICPIKYYNTFITFNFDPNLLLLNFVCRF